MKICEYGCGREARYPPSKGKLKWSCEPKWQSCPFQKKKWNLRNKKGWEEGGYYRTDDYKKNLSNSLKKAWNNEERKKYISEKINSIWNDPESAYNTIEFRRLQSEVQKITYEQIIKRYPFFCKIEEIRKNSKTGQIEAHCKNHNCPNSKEKGGWYNPEYSQLYERIRNLEKDYGNDGCFLYCSDKCKEECSEFNLKLDPNLQYTQEEYNIWSQEVLKRAENICEYCGELAEHCHHVKPQKLEPFFSLDPDYGIACCRECHYKFGHNDECSTGQLASIICK